MRISSLFPKTISDSVEKFSNFHLFQKNFSIFICQNFWRPFLVIDHKFRISSYFRYLNTFLPISENSSFPPYFPNFPLIS